MTLQEIAGLLTSIADSLESASRREAAIVYAPKLRAAAESLPDIQH